jgi:hypothetical protein
MLDVSNNHEQQTAFKTAFWIFMHGHISKVLKYNLKEKRCVSRPRRWTDEARTGSKPNL